MVRDKQRAVERGSFPGNELRAQIGKIADIFVFPHQERVQLSLLAPALRVGNSLLPQRTHVNSRLISHLKLSARKTIHLNLRSTEIDNTTRKIKIRALENARVEHPNFKNLSNAGPPARGHFPQLIEPAS